MFIKDKKWDWPILKVLKGERKLSIKFIRDLLIFVFLFKIIIINGSIVISNTLFGTDFAYGPILRAFGLL
jgi:hypothetical protein|tara:strand:- start:814 stop:1023 length:210 start_codon:yes stop_codon:yes gene_type:complete